jgi:hypothetical protein
MAIYVYVTATGALYSYSPNDTDPVATPAQLLAAGLTALTGQPPLDSTHAWSAASKSVIVVSAPPVTKPMSIVAFMQLFTPAEIAAIRASTDVNVQYFLFLAPLYGSTILVNVYGAGVIAAVNNMVTLGLITQARANVILA